LLRAFEQLERRNNLLPPPNFFSEYVGKKPVVIESLVSDWKATSRWTNDYFRSLASNMIVNVKHGYIPDSGISQMLFSDYLDSIESSCRSDWNRAENSLETPPYLHNTPLLTLLPNLAEDVTSFPFHYFPKWYWHKWWRHTQFFLGPANTVTPLHFDSLGTHNTFFQVRGKKRFLIIKPEDIKNCYMYDFFWSKNNPEDPDVKKFPLFENVSVYEAIVTPGDVLYMPPFTLHQVRSLDSCVSFNIDWHTRKSAIGWTKFIFQGMPRSRIYYNFVFLFGVVLGIPSKILYPLYKKYLS